MLGGDDRLRVHFILRILIPVLGATLGLPKLLALVDGRPDDTGTILALVGGVVGLGWWILTGRCVLVVDDSGVRRSTPFGTRALRWDELVEYRYAAPGPAPAVHGGLAAGAVAALNGGTLTLTSADDRRLTFGSGWRGASAAIARVTERLDGVRRRQLAAALRDGSPVTFGRITVQADGLVCGERPLLPWTDLTLVRVDVGKLWIRRAGQRRSYFSVATKQLPFFFLLLQVLGERGVKVVRD